MNDFTILLNRIEKEWKNEISNPESIWHINGKSNIIEKEYKKLKNGRTGYLETEVAKHLKMSVNNPEHKHRCYSTGKEMAEYLSKKYKKNISEKTIDKTQDRVHETLNVVKISFPQKVITSKTTRGKKMVTTPTITD